MAFAKLNKQSKQDLLDMMSFDHGKQQEIIINNFITVHIIDQNSFPLIVFTSQTTDSLNPGIANFSHSYRASGEKPCYG